MYVCKDVCVWLHWQSGILAEIRHIQVVDSWWRDEERSQQGELYLQDPGWDVACHCPLRESDLESHCGWSTERTGGSYLRTIWFSFWHVDFWFVGCTFLPLILLAALFTLTSDLYLTAQVGAIRKSLLFFHFILIN